MTRFADATMNTAELEGVCGGFGPTPVAPAQSAIVPAAPVWEATATNVEPVPAALSAELEIERERARARARAREKSLRETASLRAREAAHAAATSLKEMFPNLKDEDFSDAFYAVYDEMMALHDEGRPVAEQIGNGEDAASRFVWRYAIRRGLSLAYARDLAARIAREVVQAAEQADS